MSKERILFLCTGNSCRSQMAEGWVRQLHGDRYEVASAGIEKHGLNPNAVTVMDEAGVDISGHPSRNLDDLDDLEFDWVVTVCDQASESCPIFPGQAHVIHQGFDDPPKLAADIDDPDEALNCYRRVRDEIRAYAERLPEALADA